jgi:hypothetical protein
MMLIPRAGGLYASFRETIAVLGFLSAIYTGYHFLVLDYPILSTASTTSSNNPNLVAVTVQQDVIAQKLILQNNMLDTSVNKLNTIEDTVSQLHLSEAAWIKSDRKCPIYTVSH